MKVQESPDLSWAFVSFVFFLIGSLCVAAFTATDGIASCGKGVPAEESHQVVSPLHRHAQTWSEGWIPGRTHDLIMM